MQHNFDNEGLSVQSVRICYLCQGDSEILYADLRDRLFAAPGTWNIVRCISCGLAWLDPMPSIGEIDKLYVEYYTHGPANPTFGYPRSIEAAIRRVTYFASVTSLGYTDVPLRRLARIAGQLMGMIGPLRDVANGSVMWLRAETRGRLLDIGSGNGQFLAKMRSLGWDVHGLDPDAGAVHAAREHYGIDCYHGTLEQANFPDSTFDAVAMNHVVEHLHDPIGTLRECARILKPGGELVIVTPNIESLGRRRFGEHWLAWDPPRHLHLFTGQTLRRCAQGAGLQVVHMRTSARIAGVQWRASTFLRRGKRYPGKARPIRDLWPRSIAALIQLFEHGLSCVLPVGEELVMIATKTIQDEHRPPCVSRGKAPA